MARIRLIDVEPRIVPWLGSQTVQPDQVVEVPDDQYDAYVCQPAVWESVEEPAASKSTKRSVRSSTGKDGD